MAISKLAQGQVSDAISPVFTASATTNVLGIKLHFAQGGTTNTVNIYSVINGDTASDSNKFESFELSNGDSLYISEIDVLSNGDFIAMSASTANEINYKIIGEVQ